MVPNKDIGKPRNLLRWTPDQLYLLHSLRRSKEFEANGSTGNLVSPKPIPSIMTEYKDKAYKLRKHILNSQYKEAAEIPCF